MGSFMAKVSILSFYGVLKILEMSFFAWYISSHSKFFKKKYLYYLLTFGVITESILAIHQFIYQKSIGGLFYFFGERTFTAQTPGIANVSLQGELIMRPYGTLPHPNVLAGYIFISLLLIAQFLNKNNKKQAILFYITCLIGVIGMSISFSRIVFILLVLSLLILGITLKSMWERLALLGLTVVGFGLFILTNFWKRFIDIAMQPSFTERNDLIAHTLTIIKSHFFLGVGFNNFLVYLSLVDKKLGQVFFIQPVHNIYLLLFSEIGIIGLLIILLFIVRTVIHVSGNKKNRLLLLCLLSILVIGLFDHYLLTLQQGQLLSALVIGACWRDSINDNKVIKKV